jgi:hypothetical protein
MPAAGANPGGDGHDGADRGGDGRDGDLAAVVGSARAAAVTGLLLRRVLRWGQEVAPGRVFLGAPPGSAAAGLDRPPDGVTRLSLRGDTVAEQLLEGAGALLGAGSGPGAGPLLIAWPVLATWRPDHAAGALEDLAGGCALAVGPVFDGGFYLLALRGPAPWLAALAEQAWHSPEAMGQAMAAARAAGGEVGMLRAERALRGAGDVQAALADPLLDSELATILRAG